MVNILFPYIAFVLFIVIQIIGFIKGYSLSFTLSRGFLLYIGLVVLGILINKSLGYLGLKAKGIGGPQLPEDSGGFSGTRAQAQKQADKGISNQAQNKVPGDSKRYIKGLQKEIAKNPGKVAGAIEKMVRE